jgi:hypothetical protein
LGGYPGGLAAGLLRYPVGQVDQMEQDRVAFEAVRRYLDDAGRQALEDSHLTMLFGDGLRFGA